MLHKILYYIIIGMFFHLMASCIVGLHFVLLHRKKYFLLFRKDRKQMKKDFVTNIYTDID
jgi:hypothetical protein